MQSRWLLLPAAFLSLFLNSCGTGGGGIAGTSNPSGTGPFDSRGNYVEAWADNPSAWRKGNTEIVEAEPDRPAADVPVTTQQTPVLVVNETPKPGSTTTVLYKKPTQNSTASLPKPKTSTTVAKTTPKPKGSSTVAKSTPKPTVKKQVVSKSKPKSSRHTVRSGENLYNIAKRYGTSVSAIQKANGVKGAVIRPGQALVIPR